jgi:hypothetical protein
VESGWAGRYEETIRSLILRSDIEHRFESIKPFIDSIIRRPVKIEAGWSIIRGHGTSIFQQPTLSPVIIASFAPEPPQHHERPETRPSTSKPVVCLEITKNRSQRPITCMFDWQIVWFCELLGLFQRFLLAESDPKNAFGCMGYNLIHYSGLHQGGDNENPVLSAFFDLLTGRRLHRGVVDTSRFRLGIVFIHSHETRAKGYSRQPCLQH